MQVPLVDPRARESAPQYPGPLVSARKPTARKLYESIPPSVRWTLFRVLTEGVRHEKNTYGYLDAALTSVSFIPHSASRYNINPQYPLRPAVTVGTSAHEQNVSIGSVGEIFGARGTGREEDMLYPDFLVTKAIPRGLKTPRINRPVVLIEVKTMVEAERTQPPRRPCYNWGNIVNPESAFAVKEGAILPSFLVFGRFYTQLEIASNGVYEARDWQYVFEEFALPDRAPFLYRLCELAVLCWDVDA
ncbi:hypothetical protein B0H10DRAFT_2248187 [Mycena sp. CBHHK59/15]|nr:hypothetical protein B0H10DRAFT_2248187 [Mycena sp. CBHHK59/15]